MLLILASIVLLALTVALVAQNFSVPVSGVQFLTWRLSEVSLGLLLAAASLMLGGSILLKMWERLLLMGTGQKRTHRELERKEVSREEAEAQVKVLESKVQTLEKALSEALKISRT
jgi:hypothetical protein